jgi:phthalate 4,5-dioxygenase
MGSSMNSAPIDWPPYGSGATKTAEFVAPITAGNCKCLDIPSEPEDSTIRKRVKLKSYPLVRRGPVLWTYMGPPEYQPEFPEYEFAMVPLEQSYMSKRLQECNWLQAFEGGIDSSHVSWLHRSNLESDPLFKGAQGNKYNMNDMRVGFEIVEHPSGLYIGARRNAENGNYYWRITPWVMPSFTMVPPRADHPIQGTFGYPSMTSIAGRGVTTTILQGH